MTGYPWLCVLVGGPLLTIAESPEVRRYTFEMHPYCGPIRVHSQTGEPTKRDFAERSPFWDLFEQWDRHGRKVDAFGRCILGSPQ